MFIITRSKFKNLFHSFVILYFFISHSSLGFSQNSNFSYENNGNSYYNYSSSTKYQNVFEYLKTYLNLNQKAIDNKSYFVAQKNWQDISLENIKKIILYLEKRIGEENTKKVIKNGISNLIDMEYNHFISLVNFYENYLGVDVVDERLKKSLTGFTIRVQLEGENYVKKILDLLKFYLGEESLKKRLLENLSFLQDLRYIEVYNFLGYLDSIGGKNYTKDILLRNFSLLNDASLTRLNSVIKLLQSRGYLSRSNNLSEEIKDIIGELAGVSADRLKNVLDIYEKYLDKDFILHEVFKNFSLLSNSSKETIEQNIEIFKKYSNYKGKAFNEEIFKKYYKEFSLAIPSKLEEVLENLCRGSYNYFNEESIKDFVEKNYSILIEARWNKLREVIRIFERYFDRDLIYRSLTKPEGLYYFVTVDVKNFSNLVNSLYKIMGYQNTKMLLHNKPFVAFLKKADSEIFSEMVEILKKYWDEKNVIYFIQNSYHIFLKIKKENLSIIYNNLKLLYDVYYYNSELRPYLKSIFENNNGINQDIFIMDINLDSLIYNISSIANEESYIVREWILKNINVFIKILNSKNYETFINNLETLNNRNINKDQKQKLSDQNLLTLINFDSKKFKVLSTYLNLYEIEDNMDIYSSISISEINDIFSFFDKQFNHVEKEGLFKIVNKYFKNILNSNFNYMKNFIRSLLRVYNNITLTNIELILNPSHIKYNDINNDNESLNTNINIDPLKILSIIKFYLTEDEVILLLDKNFDLLYKNFKDVKENIEYIENIFQNSRISKKVIRNCLFEILNISFIDLKDIIITLSSIGIDEKDVVNVYLKDFSLFSKSGLSSLLEGIRSKKIDKKDLDKVISNQEYISIFNNNDLDIAIFSLKKSFSDGCRSLFDIE